MSIVGKARRLLFGISPRETEFERRGFHSGDDGARRHLEACGGAFVCGYNAGLECATLTTLDATLQGVETERRGFAFEGAGMALALLDALTPLGGGRLRAYLSGPAEPHTYMALVGAGWAWARLRRPLGPELRRLDPLLCWLAVDGHAFHQCFFKPDRHVSGAVPRQYTGYARRVYAQGVGRSLWFVCGADVEPIASVIERFEAALQADLWSGVGLACTYAGGVDRLTIEQLARRGSAFRPQLAQGAAFAAKARLRAGNLTQHARIACDVLCNMSAADAAHLTDTALIGLPPDGGEPAYEIWRQRLQMQFAAVGRKEAHA